jgi:hypothetical protein
MLKAGTEIAGYRIEGVLGHGGMGMVYEATQRSLNRIVALKILSPELSTDISFRQRFRREGEIQAAIDHPHIVTVFEAGEIDAGLFIAMRLVRGPTLKDMIIGRELEAGRTLRILYPIADALDTAHGAGLIHRDIKPQNVLVGPRDHAFLADFGLTNGANESGLTRTGQFVGTIDYISPEQIRGEPARPASDIYALSAVLYECLTGVVPYAKPSDAAVLFAHMTDPPPLVTEQRPELPPALNDVILRGMAKDPDERQRSAEELLQEAELAFGRRIRAVITPPGPITIPEEIGIREDEGKVPTRETRVREAAELADAAAAAEATRAKPPADPTRVADAAPTGEAAAPPVTEAAEVVEEPPAVEEPASPTRVSPGETTAPVTEPLPPEPAEATRAGTAPTRPGQVEQTRAGRATPATAAMPEPTAPAAAPARPAPPSRVLAIGALVIGVLVLVGGFLIGNSGGGDKEPALSNSATSSDVGLSSPTGWQRGSAPDLAGMKFENPLALTKTGKAGTGVVAGQVAATGPTLLPAALLRKLSSTPKTGDPVKLGKVAAYRYKDLKPSGSDSAITVYAIPTDAGVATVACYRPKEQAADADCERIAGSLTLERGKAYPLEPIASYGTAVGKAVSSLDSARTSGRKALSSAKSAKAQATAATQLASSYRSAASSLAGLKVSPAVADANAAIVSALRDTATAYSSLASAARAGQPKNYTAASSKVDSGEAAVQKAVAGLKELGYNVSS